jgi:hypothetical protein
VISIEVKVTGPGGIINYEMGVIEQALVAAGIPVRVVNPYPDDCVAHGDKIHHNGVNVTLVANHLPWGG